MYKTQKDMLMTFSKFSFKALALSSILEDSGVQFSKQISPWVHQVENLHHVEVLFCSDAQWEAIAAQMLDDIIRSIIKGPLSAPPRSSNSTAHQTICIVKFVKSAMLV